MKLGGIEFNGAILAPMAGITDLPFRIIAKEYGAALSYTEMISAKGLIYNNENTRALLSVEGERGPAAVQIFGSEPQVMADAADLLKAYPFAFIDINMGCPAPKIVKNGEGCALMKDPALAGGIISAVVSASDKPVTVKIRKGFGENNAALIARVAEESGAVAVAVHGRTREQYYSGAADWELISELKHSVNIPVIGTGDIKSAQDAKRMIEETGCDAVMIGRAACGNPWIFSECAAMLACGEIPPPPSMGEKMSAALRHFELLVKVKGEYTGVREMRRHLSYYIKGLEGAAVLRGRAVACENTGDMFALINELIELFVT